MSFEHQLRPALDNLTARLRGDLERHLDAALQELSDEAGKIAQESEAESEQALADAVREVEAAGEEAARRHRAELDEALSLQAELERRLADAEQRAADAWSRATEAEHRLQEAAARQADAESRQLATLREAEVRLQQVFADNVAQAVGQANQHAESRLLQATTEHQTLLQRTVSEHEARLTRSVEEVQNRTLSSLQAADLAAGARLVEAFRAIDRAQALTDILNVLANAVADEATRSAIFLAGSAQVKSWRTNGFAPTVPIEVPLTEAGLIAAALESRESCAAGGDGGDDSAAKAPAFAGLADDRGAIAVPMLVNDEVVAVVYADQGAHGDVDRTSWACIVELLARHASRSLEAITAHRLAQTLGSGASRPRAVSKPADVVVSPVMQPVVRQAPQPVSVAVAPAPFSTPDAVVSEASAAAQRFAQTLIADIRASHELDVLAGQRDRDLMTRLGGPISQAWAQYEARVPEGIRTGTNYFHAELVRTLANGDASLLTPKP